MHPTRTLLAALQLTVLAAARPQLAPRGDSAPDYSVVPLEPSQGSDDDCSASTVTVTKTVSAKEKTDRVTETVYHTQTASAVTVSVTETETVTPTDAAQTVTQTVSVPTTIFSTASGAGGNQVATTIFATETQVQIQTLIQTVTAGGPVDTGIIDAPSTSSTSCSTSSSISSTAVLPSVVTPSVVTPTSWATPTASKTDGQWCNGTESSRV
ncbi:hypothetical protein GMORB2_6102 [Geosmithia morbida]|uniref:Uncharacterized protein n=1 Tax=Geosmithia morbida TaxID=1094350 RepID=A0A9P4YX87_9HYPO|nr:uncharacterized protein GMORB2_6102 [Geosmithia morbida]KAF4123401.1 hypothetical protein GMORB2_6102 [Geosmithia morbida]